MRDIHAVCWQPCEGCCRPAMLSRPSHPYASFLDRVLKPARYTGGEAGVVVKDWSAVDARVCLCFPDIYDIGMSHLGLRILYKILGDDPRTLAERCYAPWKDVEAELRARRLPLVSLESYRPLADFDVVGFSLQFELTYTNVLNMLELGGVAVRSGDRPEEAPLVVAGGPNATHPEPLADFVDAFVLGDGEAKLTEVALEWTRLRGLGVGRRDRLRALAALGGIYVPALYPTEIDAESGLQVVVAPTDPAVPFPVKRTMVRLADYPFPDDGPTGGPEAVFDRTSIEITRGCTEGCRFCQAGMIYRPVQERDPAEVVRTVLSAVEKSGNDEVSLTALSTADVSYIHPLIKELAPRLQAARVSLSVSSLRAYGLDSELLDELGRVRAGGLTFAPEAGSQRMRDVVNKNVTEEQLQETAERVFSRGYTKMKLYFMIGLPTEQDDDVRGIVETAVRASETARRAARTSGRGDGRAEITVSVSTHVPKPHTPFQWAAMDSLAEVDRKQDLLRNSLRQVGVGPTDADPRAQASLRRAAGAVKLRTHDAEGSVLEGILARGDRRLGRVIERAFRAGARFDSWDDELRVDVWRQALTEAGVDRQRYLGTIPVSARLPWSHMDVGLEDGFLAREYRRALRNRLSPPCGKVAGSFVHATNVEDALAETKRLVCYDCGVACDLGSMREERLVFLRRLGALERPAATPGATGTERVSTSARMSRRAPVGDPRAGRRYRFRFAKLGPAALLGHLDLVRELPRLFRRLGVGMIYSGGFHPKPQMTFSSALSLGVASLDEYVDIRLEPSLSPPELIELTTHMTASGPRGLDFLAATPLAPADPSISKLVRGAHYAIAFAEDLVREVAGTRPPEWWLAERCGELAEAPSLLVRRRGDGPLDRVLDLRPFVINLQPWTAQTRTMVQQSGLTGRVVGVEAAVAICNAGSAKAAEIAALLFRADGNGPTAALAPPHHALRTSLVVCDRATDGASEDARATDALVSFVAP